MTDIDKYLAVLDNNFADIATHFAHLDKYFADLAGNLTEVDESQKPFAIALAITFAILPDLTHNPIAKKLAKTIPIYPT